MVLDIVNFGHPVLRQKGVRIDAVTPEIEELIRDMFDTMREAAGVGLAAQQVGRALQLAVIDVRPAKDRPSTMEVDGQAVDPNNHMPLVLINPEIRPFGEQVKGGEGCLSFPEVYAEVVRPESVEVSALNAKGERINFKAGGLLSRAVQHEVDHLNGVLFVDRMSREVKAEVQDELDAIHESTKAAMKNAPKPSLRM
jgi:peptide deformylase